jgi:hypothetical protein
MTSSMDFDLNGMVGVRLLDAGPKDTEAVARQLGLPITHLKREPDITLRFVDRLTPSARLRYLGVDDAAFTDDAFYVLRSLHKTRVKVQVPFQNIGEKCEIVCERGLPAVPLMIPILNLTALNHGALPLHASAFNYKDQGLVALGWAKGGKTETLLAFMLQGAEYVGDEWVYFTCDGKQMFGIPEPIRLWDWHLSDVPEIRSRISREGKAKLLAIKTLVKTLQTAGNGAGGSAARLARRVSNLLQRQMYVHASPQHLFGENACVLQGQPQKLFFVGSHDSPNVIVEPVDPLEIARRMVFSLEEERHDLWSYYLKFRFAFPHLRNELLERSQVLQLDALEQILAGKEAYSVYHPYPVHIPALFDAMRPYCEPHSLRSER